MGRERVYSMLTQSSGINLYDVDATVSALARYEEVWLLLDDAQNTYDEVYWPFWESLVKGLNVTFGKTARKIHCVIAATYDLNTPTTPVAFVSMSHIPERGTRMLISDDEADELFVEHTRGRDCVGWDRYRETLKYISKGHIGVFTQGIVMLENMSLTTPRVSLSEDDALDMLRGSNFFDCLGRCFPKPLVFDPTHRGYIIDAIVAGEVHAQTDAMMDIERAVQVPEVTFLKRAGILTRSGAFTCLAASWYYYNRIFPGRAFVNPPDIETLVINSVSSMSATRLRAACHNGTFPKEAAFQQLFNEAMSRQLTSENTIIPEMNTQAIIDGKVVKGVLDFYINGPLQWALELMCSGDRLREHIKRIDGKYREVKAKAYLVVDCRGPKKSSVQGDPQRCTIFFSHDFTTCVCEMRNQPGQVLHLEE